MTPIKFKESNCVYAEKQPEYLSLPALKIDILDSIQQEVISCWKLTLWERIKLLFIGKIWHSAVTFGNPLQPISLTTSKPFKIKKDDLR